MAIQRVSEFVVDSASRSNDGPAPASLLVTVRSKCSFAERSCSLSNRSNRLAVDSDRLARTDGARGVIRRTTATVRLLNITPDCTAQGDVHGDHGRVVAMSDLCCSAV